MADTAPPPTPERRRHRASPARFLILSTVLLAIGLFEYSRIWSEPVVLPEHATPLWLVPVVTTAFWACLIELRFGRSTVSFGVTEVPIILGSFLVAPRFFLPCYVAGGFVAFVIRRGVRPLKDYGNASINVVCCATNRLIFQGIGPDHAHPFGFRSMLAVVVAILISDVLLNTVVLEAGQYFLQGALNLESFVRGTLLQAVLTANNICLGTLALLVMVNEPWLFVTILPPAVLVFTLQSNAAENRRRADGMESLLKVADTVHSARRVEDVSHHLLQLVASIFTVEHAELLLLADGPSGDLAIRFQLSDSGPSYDPPTMREWQLIRQLARQDAGGRPGGALDATRDVLEERHAYNGLFAILQGTERPLGMISVLNTASLNQTFSRTEESLLNAIARQISTSLAAGELASQIQVMSSAMAEMEQRAMYDSLTRLANRTLFHEQLCRALSQSARTRTPIAVLFIDLDGFKPVNDRYGHDAGDVLLIEVGRRLGAVVRQHDIAARFGGDEFALLLGAMHDSLDAVTVAERVLASLRQAYVLPNNRVAHVQASVGVAVLDGANLSVSAQELTKAADAAMYEAKRQGKNRYVVVRPGIRQAPRTESVA